MFYYGNVYKGDIRVSDLTTTESEATAWLVSQLVRHLVEDHGMRKGFYALLQAVEAIKAVMEEGEASCPFCEAWKGSVEIFEYEGPRPRMFVVVEEEAGHVTAERRFSSFLDALSEASRDWRWHQKLYHHEEFPHAPLRSRYACGCYRSFRVYVKPFD